MKTHEKAGLAPMEFGATLLTPNSTRFRLWAPDASAVSVEVQTASGGRSIAMAAKEGGWFEVDADCGAGTRYRFRIGADLSVPDPASRMQDGDIHDASIVVDPDAYAWRCADWKGRPWHEAVIYEVHAGALGGFDGARRHLQRLADLGVTAIELMPVADFPGPHNWGYDGVLPYAPDRAYGTPEELKALIDHAHELGLMVFLDVVYNHFGPDGNYLHAYADSFFRSDMQTPWGPAIDFRRREVRDFFTGNAIYWLNEYRFDGLRFDAVHAIPEPGWLDDMARVVRACIAPERHVHLVLEHDGNVASHLELDFDAQWNDDGHHVLHHLITGESGGYYADYATQPAQLLARCLTEGFIYQGQPSVYRGGEARGEPSAHLDPTHFVLFLQNHDQIGNRAMGERLLTLAQRSGRVGALRAATALLLLSPQIPLIFMGEELGAGTPFLYFTSHEEKLAEAVREGRRREFAQFPEFADEEKRACIPDPNDPQTYSSSTVVMSQSLPTRHWPDYFRQLLQIRGQVLMPLLAEARSLDATVLGDRALVARWQLAGRHVLSIFVNLGDEPVALAAKAGGRLLFESEPEGAHEAGRGWLAAACTLAYLEGGAS